MAIETFRKRPVVVHAVRWTGDNEGELQEFTGDRFNAVAEEDRHKPEITAEVFDDLHDTWVGVKTGQWIIRGVKGEYYPCDDDVLVETYERVEPTDG